MGGRKMGRWEYCFMPSEGGVDATDTGCHYADVSSTCCVLSCRTFMREDASLHKGVCSFFVLHTVTM